MGATAETPTKNGAVLPSEHAFVFLAGGFVLAASFLNFLRYHEYPLLTPEVGLVGLGLVALALLVGLLYRGCGRGARALFEGLLVFLAVELNAAHSGYAALAGLAVVAFVLIRRRSILPFLGTMAFIAALVGFLGIGREQANALPSSVRPTAASDKPAILHLILDEHIGIEGFPKTKLGAETREAIKGFYLSRGFRLSGRAYSEHFDSVNAIPHILNFGALQAPPRGHHDKGTAIPSSAYFGELSKRSYRVNVYQSEYIDFCADPRVASCTGYLSQDIRPLIDSPLSATDRAGLVAVQFAFLSKTLKALSGSYSDLAKRLRKEGRDVPDFGLPLGGRTSMINGTAIADRLARGLRHARPGEAYFAHILFPHSPYATTPDCGLKDVDRWTLRTSGAPIEAREAAYYDQLRCAMNKVDAALRALEASPAGRNHIVIVHGDHGSRITRHDPALASMGRFTDSDLVSSYSTLFAVRAPALAPG